MDFKIPIFLIVAGAIIFYLWPLLLIAGGVAIGALIKGASTVALIAGLVFFSPLILGVTAQIVFPVLNWAGDTYIGKKIGAGIGAGINGVSNFFEWVKTPSLVYAVEKQDEKKVIKLLKKGKNPNCHGGEFDYTPLQQSCEEYTDIEKADRITLLLLEHGAAPNIDNEHYSRLPIHRAIYSDRKNAVNLLLSHGAVFTEYTIGDCFEQEFFEEAEYMLNHIENPEKISPCAFNDWYDPKSTVFIYIMQKYDKSYEENFEIMNRIFTMLLERGCNVNARDDYGETALYCFAQRYAGFQYEGYAALAKMLVRAGADVNIADKRGNTPLIALIDYDKSKTISTTLAVTKLLLSFGADVSVKNEKGMTALDTLHENFRLENCSPEEVSDYKELERLLTVKAPKLAMRSNSKQASELPETFLLGYEKHTELSDMIDNW